jgi:hypothetical protein
VRLLLRWSSLLGCAALLAWFGAGRTHQQDFPLFLAAVVGLSLLTVVLFVLTAPRGGTDRE